MSRRPLAFVMVFVGVLACTALAQDRPPVSPGVGNAVLLATNSIQLDRDVNVLSGDVIVNDAASGGVLGEAELSLDSNARTAAGFRIAADTIDLDHDAFVGGDAHYNQLLNDRGTIAGLQVTPLALPVYGSLPSALHRSHGTVNVVVPNNGTVQLEVDGDNPFGSLTVGRNATVIFTGGGYAFSSITVDRNSSLLFAGASTVVVNGRMAIARNSVIGPAAGSGLTASSIHFYVHGLNGSAGGIGAQPPAVGIAESSTVAANIHASAGSLVFDQNITAAGAFFALDIRVGRACRFSLASATNNPPLANAQTVFTSGATPLTITLTGVDPEGAALTFSIDAQPTAGTLSALTPTSANSATVVYTPSSGGNLTDSFTFRVTDPGAASGAAVVSINPGLDDNAPTTVVANDSSRTVFTATLANLGLSASAPAGVSVTFAIVSGSGPSHGTLGTLTQGTESPQRTASVEYTSDAGYTGPDSFDFTACGTIGTSTVCDTGTVSINVATAPVEPPTDIVTDVSVSVPAEGDVLISLSGNSIEESSRRLTLKPKAAFLAPAAVGGNVADSNNDGLGDNHNDLPGATPLLMSAGVGSSGGAGSNGTKRMHMEWDISQFGTGAGLVSADVELYTHRGTIDSLDTHFVVGASSGDGLLTDSDFEIDSEVIGGVVMPVPPTMAVGSDGTFSFDVLSELRAALAAGHTHLVIQGRVDESTTGTARGLEVYTTADGNVDDFKVPALSLTTPGVVEPTVYRVLSLPSNGTLFDGTTQITGAPYTLAGSTVRYVPNTGFSGPDSFQFEAALSAFSDQALVNILVFLGNCANNAAHCNDGR